METQDSDKRLDESQQQVVDLQNGSFLVLAPPGCGKTHLLAERVRHAYKQGFTAEDMLCLTFTNRAAREMQKRIITSDSSAHAGVAPFVGNIHRFCSKFLFESGEISADSSVIDDEEAVSIIADYLNEDEENVLANYQRVRQYQRIIFLSHLLEQRDNGHPRELYIHPEVEEDLQKPSLVGYARQYAQYKKENHMLDFEDLLLTTYEIYRQEKDCRHYSWIQVDEVQDLNAMQLAIVDLLLAKEHPTVMYLGDEQQAIFSFMGAKVEMLDLLKQRCQGQIYHLRKNHRSPGYLLDVFNDYAEKVLHISRDLLPTTDNREQSASGMLRLIHSSTMESEVYDVVNLAKDLLSRYPEETTAVIVNANADADHISEEMATVALNHFKVSGRDLFDTKEVKLILAHLSVLANERHFIGWARLMKGLRVFPTNPLARRFLRKLKLLGISPVDFLTFDHATYVSSFVKMYEQQELVVFDTETTGTNPQEDDVIEISAMRVMQGRIVGEPLDLYICTDKEIPAMLGVKVNPMKSLYGQKAQAGELLERDNALRIFLEYVGNRPVVGHNVMFDVQMVRAMNGTSSGSSSDDSPLLLPIAIDTLKLMHLLEPSLHSYKLESLLDRFHLSGENSHRAIDDVGATVSLLALCYAKGKEKVAEQLDFISHPRVRPYVNKWRANYQELFVQSQKRLYQMNQSDTPALVNELEMTYDYLCENGYMKKVTKLHYLTDYLRMDVLTDAPLSASLSQQLAEYMMELNTMKEADFCNSRSMLDKVYVTTVHKAKGLEFDHVIVFDAVAGRYPNYYNKHPRQDAEDARKFYVAMSRAKKQLYVAYSMQSVDRFGGIHNRELTPFMNDILSFFD